MARKRVNEIKREVKIQSSNKKLELQETKATIIRIVKAAPESNMTAKEARDTKYTRRGIVSIDEKEYFFIANKFGMPVVFGATSIEPALELAKALNNKMIECGKEENYFDEDAKISYSKKSVYTKEISDGIMIFKQNNEYMGYMVGKNGRTRAVMYRKGGKPYSCSVDSFIKTLDNPGMQPFRQMEHQGEDIKNMIKKFMQIIALIEDNESANTNNRKVRARRNSSSNETIVVNKAGVEDSNTLEEKEIVNEKPAVTRVRRVNKQRTKDREKIRSEDIINNDEKLVEVVEKLFTVAVKDNVLHELFIKLTGHSVHECEENILEYNPSISEIAECFREDVSVLLTNDCYYNLRKAIE